MESDTRAHGGQTEDLAGLAGRQAVPRDQGKQLAVRLAELTQRAAERRIKALEKLSGSNGLGGCDGRGALLRLRAPSLVGEDAAGDGEQPRQLVTGHALQPSPGDQEGLGGNVLGISRAPPSRVREHRAVIRAEELFEASRVGDAVHYTDYVAPMAERYKRLRA